MKKWLVLFQTEAVLYCRDVFGAFLRFAFPVLMLVLFGSIYGNAPGAVFLMGWGASTYRCRHIAP